MVKIYACRSLADIKDSEDSLHLRGDDRHVWSCEGQYQYRIQSVGRVCHH